MITKKYLDDLTYRVIGCAIEVHKQIVPGLIGSVYEKCLAREFELRNIQYQKQLWVMNIFKEGQKTLVSNLFAVLPNE
jgi:GxxExxY protein